MYKYVMIVFLIIPLCVSLARSEEEVNCRKEKCFLSFETAEGNKYNCGRMRITKNKSGTKFLSIKIPCVLESTPIPTRTPARTQTPTRTQIRTPQPTITPIWIPNSFCIDNPDIYCWETGAFLSGGNCFSNCNCILRKEGTCAN